MEIEDIYMDSQHQRWRTLVSERMHCGGVIGQ